MKSKPDETSGKVERELLTGMNRRVFLGGSAATLAMAGALSRTANALPPTAILLSVGYWVGSDQFVLSESAIPTTASSLVTSASAMGPDVELMNSGAASIMVQGLFGAAIDPKATRFDLMAYYKTTSSTAQPSLPVYVWSYQSGPVIQTSASSRFAMPVDAHAGITFGVSPQPGAAKTTAPASPALTGLNRSGVYFVALDSTTTRAWSTYAFMPDPASKGLRRLFLRTVTGMKAVSFPYLVLAVAPEGARIQSAF